MLERALHLLHELPRAIAVVLDLLQWSTGAYYKKGSNENTFNNCLWNSRGLIQITSQIA